MDAQNAVESSSTKQPASPKRGDTEPGDVKARATASAVASKFKSPVTSKLSSTAKDTRPNAQEEDSAHDQNSDAETIVLPGKDGIISPSKPRKVIKHEDKSDGEIDDVLPPPRKPLRDGADANGGPSDGTAGTASSLSRKRRPLDREKQPHLRVKDASSGLSSAPTSPPHHHRNLNNLSHRRHRSGDAQSESGSESSKSRTHRLGLKDKSKSVERLLSGKRKAVKTESDEEGEPRKIRRPRLPDATVDTSVAREKDHKPASGRPSDKQPTIRTRSTSPHARPHRRSLSTQLPSQSSNGFPSKKRRIPAPLQSTDYQSDDSSASGSPHPRSSRLKSIATPLTGDSIVSPAKMPPHKKHVDNHGQTLFAKACAKGEFEVAKRRLAERPEDLNFADYAGNTPLQVASLNGHENIVQLLLDAGCQLDCRNSDKDTPLLDAVENGHLGVVQLLLKAGVNPRKADAEGHEPLEKVPDDLDNAEEIRAALREAKERVGELRRTSEDHHPQDLHDALSSQGLESPRNSPAASGSTSLAAQRRGGTVRSTKTSNHLLYMNLDDKTLRQAAARGDHETVTRILQVKDRCDDPEALVNAARGGHSLVVELLLALGNANPDPRPVPGLPLEHGTPMLAAIGQENIQVVKLLLDASAGFDPTKRYKGQTYYEVARRREGPNWKEEEHILKNAYDDYKKTSKGSAKAKVSPGKRERDAEADTRRGARNEASPDANRSHKRRQSSPGREGDSKKKSSAKATSSPKEKRRSLSFGNQDEQTSPKRGPGRPKKEEREQTSEPEVSPVVPKTHTKPKLAEPDLAAGSSDGETVKPRRKLISGKDLKGQREKQRRASMASINSTNDRTDAKMDDAAERPRADRLSEKYHDRTKALKRDDSKDRLSAGDSPSKRNRSSVTPPRHASGEKDDIEAPSKRRKLDAEGREKRHLQPPSPEDRQRRRDPSRESAGRHRSQDLERKESSKSRKANPDGRDSDKSNNVDQNSITVASESPDIEMRDAPVAVMSTEVDAQAERERQDAKTRQAEADATAAAEEEARKEAVRARQEEERRKREAEARIKEREAEAEARRLEQEERQRLAREELKRKEDEENARLEAEQKKREEEDQKRREEEERREKEEQDRKQREEEERIRREREAAEARRRQEEEDRLEEERKRAELAAREAELQRAREEEEERARVAKLPPLFRWLDACPDPKRKEIAELFAKPRGIRYDTIVPSATGQPGGRDQWLLNTQVALLLGEKDLTLSRYPHWERIPAGHFAKLVIWRIEQEAYSLTQQKVYHLGRQLPGYYDGDPYNFGTQMLLDLKAAAWPLWTEMDMFFVKESDFLQLVPTVPHLRDVKISIWYCELPEDEEMLRKLLTPKKWKRDPDAVSRGFAHFAPRAKHYVNAQLVGEDKPQKYTPSKTPFPENRVPRRRGYVAVEPHESDYVQLCLEQNLTHLLTEQQKQSALNGAHLTPRSMASNELADYTVGTPSSSTNSRVGQVNGVPDTQATPEELANGTDDDESDSGH